MSEAHSQGAHPSHEIEDVERQDKGAPWPSGTTGVSAARRGTSSLSEVASARDRVSGEKGHVGEIAGSARDSFNETPEVERDDEHESSFSSSADVLSTVLR